MWAMYQKTEETGVWKGHCSNMTGRKPQKGEGDINGRKETDDCQDNVGELVIDIEK